MGTKIENIEKHYSHLISRDRRAETVKTDKAKEKATKQNSDDAVAMKALALFKDGKLSEAALLEIVKRG